MEDAEQQPRGGQDGNGASSESSYVGLVGSTPPIKFKMSKPSDLSQSMYDSLPRSESHRQSSWSPLMSGSLEKLTPAEEILETSDSTQSVQNPQFSEAGISDKMLFIKQQQLLLQEKQEQLKLLKKQRRRSLMGSPNPYMINSPNSPCYLNTSGETASPDPSHSTTNSDTRDLLIGLDVLRSNGLQYAQRLGNDRSDSFDQRFGNDRSDSFDHLMSTDFRNADASRLIDDTQSELCVSEDRDMLSNKDLYVYSAREPRKNVYASIPESNSDLRTSTVLPLSVRQNESVV